MAGREGNAPVSQVRREDSVVMFCGTKVGPSFALLPTRMCCPFKREAVREVLGSVVMKPPAGSVTGRKAQFP